MQMNVELTAMAPCRWPRRATPYRRDIWAAAAAAAVRIEMGQPRVTIKSGVSKGSRPRVAPL